MKYTHSTPKKWTKKEVDFLQRSIKEGRTIADIARHLGRTETSVSIKKKRLNKKTGTYNDRHRAEKYEANLRFLQHLKPKSVLDLYAGETSYYSGLVENLVSNDIHYPGHNFQDDAKYTLAKLYANRHRFDLVDLDPFGSAFDCFEMAVQLARKGLIITFGEMGHKRWARTDYVGRTYRITDVNDLTLENLANYVIEVAKRFKKKAIVHSSFNWLNIGRVYFVLEELPKQAPRI